MKFMQMATIKRTINQTVTPVVSSFSSFFLSSSSSSSSSYYYYYSPPPPPPPQAVGPTQEPNLFHNHFQASLRPTIFLQRLNT